MNHRNKAVTGDFKARKKIKNPFIEKKQPQGPNPQLLITLLGFLVGGLSLGFGIYLNQFGCGSKYLTLCVLGILVSFSVFTCAIISCIKSLNTLRYIYIIIGVVSFLIGIISLSFIKVVQNQTYCSYMFCHAQVDATSNYTLSPSLPPSETEVEAPSPLAQAHAHRLGVFQYRIAREAHAGKLLTCPLSSESYLPLSAHY